MKSSSPNVECASHRRTRRELGTKMAQISKDLKNLFHAVSRKSANKVAQMEVLFEVRFTGILKRLQSGLRFGGVNLSNEMKKVLKYCNIGSHLEFASYVAMLSKWLTDVRKVDANDALGSDSTSREHIVSDVPANIGEQREESLAA